ncbi:MAG: plastocyanin/azurin family copper-binding protein [Opitutales bacterium]|jgi:azurin|nr:plastocyanin/azurin family copper-binding protein [Opitutales bacterium]
MNKSYLPILLIALISGSFMYNHIVSAKDEKVDVTVEFNGTDTMMYSKTAFEVKSGQKVKLVFKNAGKLPKVAMGHNVVILKKGVSVATFCTEAIKFAAEGYFPKTKKDDVIAATKLLGPDETDTVIFTAPAAGVYDYVCTFPGHFALMKGKMTVK